MRPADVPDQTSYTYVSEWGVPRDKWADYLASQEKLKPIVEKLMADGTLIGWGNFAVAVHTAEGYTHGSWWTARTLGDLLRAEDVIAQTPTTMNPALAGMKHEDHLFRSLASGGKPGASGSGYLWVSMDPLVTGQMSTFVGILKGDIQPLFDRLVTEGTVLEYAVNTEVVHTQNENTIFITYLLNGPDALDKFRAAVAAAEAKIPSFEPAANAVVHGEGHRDLFLRVTAFAAK